MLTKDIKLIFHEKRMLVMIGLIAALAVAVFLLAKPKATAPGMRMGVADLDDSEYSRMLIDYFRDNEVFSSYISITDGSVSEVRELLEAGDIDLYLIIPEDFASNLIRIENTPIEVCINSSDKTKAVIYRNLLESYGKYITAAEVNCQGIYDLMREDGFERSEVDRVNVSLSYELVFTALGKDAFFKRADIDRFEGISLVNYYIYSALMIIIMYIAMFSGLGALEERLGCVYRRLATTGVGRFKLVISRVTAYLLVMGGLLTAMMIVAAATDRIEFGFTSWLFAIGCLILFCFICIVMSGLFGTASGYIIFMNMLVLFLAIVGGGIIPVMYLPEAMARVAEMTPNYWFIKLLL